MIWLVCNINGRVLGAYNNEAAASMHASDVGNGYVETLELDVEREYEKEKRSDGND